MRLAATIIGDLRQVLAEGVDDLVHEDLGG